jgi:hypothetical protein
MHALHTPSFLALKTKEVDPSDSCDRPLTDWLSIFVLVHTYLRTDIPTRATSLHTYYIIVRASYSTYCRQMTSSVDRFNGLTIAKPYPYQAELRYFVAIDACEDDSQRQRFKIDNETPLSPVTSALLDSGTQLQYSTTISRGTIRSTIQESCGSSIESRLFCSVHWINYCR